MCIGSGSQEVSGCLFKIISVLWWSEARLVCIEEYTLVFTASLAGHLSGGELSAVKKINHG